MRRAHHREKKQTNTDFSFFLFLYLFSSFSPKFKRAAGFCRLGSYSGRNTRPSSYSPSCPSLTELSPSVTSSSDRRRPLGLCQNWVMCECWTGIRERNKTLHTEGQKSKDQLSVRLSVLGFAFGREHARIMWETSRRGRKELKENELSSHHR